MTTVACSPVSPLDAYIVDKPKLQDAQIQLGVLHFGQGGADLIAGWHGYHLSTHGPLGLRPTAHPALRTFSRILRLTRGPWRCGGVPPDRKE
jgi:hypothetical protein